MMQAGGKNVPSALQRLISVIVSPFLVDITLDTALDIFAASNYVIRTVIELKLRLVHIENVSWFHNYIVNRQDTFQEFKVTIYLQLIHSTRSR